jgi:hypothetical protein
MEDAPATRTRGKRLAAFAAAAALAGLSLAATGCGGDPDPADPVLERGPAPPAGALVETPATLRQGFSSLGALEVNSTAEGEALVVGLAVVSKGQPTMRLLVNDKPVSSETNEFRGGGGTVAAIYCSCKLERGENTVGLEGRGREAVVGTRTLMTFTPAAGNELPASNLVSAVGVEDERIGVNPSGSVLATTELESAADEVLLLSAYRSPAETSASPQAIRTEALIGGEAMDEVANASMPDGKLAVYYSGESAPAGTEIDLVGFTVTGSAHAHAAALAVCPCGLDEP